MLSLKFGRETANYFSGSPLNRLSFLRSDHEFLRLAFSHPSAAFLLMNSLNPLVKDNNSHLAFVTTPDIEPLTGPDPFGKKDEELIRDFNSEETQPLILFLGVDERDRLLPNANVNGSGSGSDASTFQYKEYKGSPYFAVDITPRGTLTEVANGIITTLEAKGLSFHDSSSRHMGLRPAEAAIYGQARALLD